MNCIVGIQSHLSQMLAYSGKSIFRIGEYGNCVENPSMDYKLIQASQNSNPLVTIFYGLCLPKQCKASLVRTILEELLHKNKIDLTILSVDEDLPNIEYSYGIRFFITIFLITAAILMVMLASCSKQIGKHHVLSAFSLKNSLKIFQSKANRLNTLNGIRSLAMLWVIFGHEYGLVLSQVSNLLNLKKIASNSFFLLIQAGFFAVDTFFFVGGFLVAYSVLKEQINSKLSYFLAIINRFLRFLPSYLLAILIYCQFLKHMGSGPFWKVNMFLTSYCSDLWKPLLYVDNLIDNGQYMCMNWGWYLQNDMQLFIVCMVILLMYSKSKNMAYLLVFLCMAGSWAFSMQYTYDNSVHQIARIQDEAFWGNFFLDVYVKPWGRCPPYLYGLFFGMLYSQFLAHENKHSKNHFLFTFKEIFQKRPFFRKSWELFGLLLAVFIVFIPRTAQGDNQWPQIVHSLYLTYAKFIFVFALSIVVLPSLLGVKSFIREILDTKFFSWIAKISFWTYLIHLTIIYQWFGSIKSDYYFALIPTYGLFVSHSVMSLGLGLFFTLVIEAPMSRLQKKLLHSLKQKTIKPQKNEIISQLETK